MKIICGHRADMPSGWNLRTRRHATKPDHTTALLFIRLHKWVCWVFSDKAFKA